MPFTTACASGDWQTQSDRGQAVCNCAEQLERCRLAPGLLAQRARRTHMPANKAWRGVAGWQWHVTTSRSSTPPPCGSFAAPQSSQCAAHVGVKVLDRLCQVGLDQLEQHVCHGPLGGQGGVHLPPALLQAAHALHAAGVNQGWNRECVGVLSAAKPSFRQSG